eukprot:jgi/Mesvir1/10127/Mv15045-RA.1
MAIGGRELDVPASDVRADYATVAQTLPPAQMPVMSKRASFAYLLQDASEGGEIQWHELEYVKTTGEGAFASVGEFLFRGQRCAVKMLKPEALAEAEQVRDFAREIRVMRALNHPNIAKVIGWGVRDLGEETADFIVEELLTGGTLEEPVDRHMVLPEEAITWCLDVADALCYLHTQSPSIVHRDLKLGNLCLNSERRACVVDFGLCKLKDSYLHDRSRNLPLPPILDDVSVHKGKIGGDVRAKRDSSELGAGEEVGRFGSYRYMPPEVFRRQPHSEKVDVYSFAIVAWELLSNQRSFPSDRYGRLSPLEMGQMAADGERPTFPRHFPQDLRQLLSACWDDDPDKRPAFTDIHPQLLAMRDRGMVAAFPDPRAQDGCCQLM